MATRLVFLILALSLLTEVTGQHSYHISEIDKTVDTIDQVVTARINIVEYIHPLFSDDGGEVFLNHRYTIDTARRILYKAVYEYANFEQVSFYYDKRKIIKAIVSDTTEKKMPYKCEYYFNNGSITSIKEEGTPGPQHSWNKETIALQAQQYLTDFLGVCAMLDKQK